MSESSEISLIVAAIASAVAAIVYSAKHIRSSTCFGGLFECNQVVVDRPSCLEKEGDGVDQNKIETNL